jgi:hypothetical protein
LFDTSAPADMFSPIVSTASPSPSKSQSSPLKYIPPHSKTLLAHNDFGETFFTLISSHFVLFCLVPVYDARKTVVDFNADLERLSNLLPMFHGEIPFGSFIVVGYTCASYMATLSGSSQRVAHLGCNVLWVIVCGTPPLKK